MRARTLPALVMAVALLLLSGGAAHAQSRPTDLPELPEDAVPAAQVDLATCGVSYHAMSVWSTGFVSEVDVHNTGTVPVSWQVTVVLAAGVLDQGWNGEFTGIGDVIFIEPVAWNQVIPPGESRPVGFIGIGEADLHSITVACSPA